jgi:glutathionyl-hydroquinone reductase
MRKAPVGEQTEATGRTHIARITPPGPPLADYPNLWPYARDLYQQPAFGGTTDFDHIKGHYFGTHPRLNPSRIVPAGPLLNWQEPHHRERLAA